MSNRYKQKNWNKEGKNFKMENNENNVQNQEKKQSKGLSVGLVIIMLIAVLIIGVGGGYLLSN